MTPRPFRAEGDPLPAKPPVFPSKGVRHRRPHHTICTKSYGNRVRRRRCPVAGCRGRFCTGNLRECVPQDRSYDGWLISYLNDFACFLP